MRIAPISNTKCIFNSSISFQGIFGRFDEKKSNSSFHRQSPFKKDNSQFHDSFQSSFDDVEKTRQDFQRKAQEMQEQIQRIRRNSQQQQEQCTKQYQQQQEKAYTEFQKRQDEIRKKQEKINAEFQKKREKIRMEQERIRKEQEKRQEEYARRQRWTHDVPPKHPLSQKEKKYNCSEECQKDLEQLFKPLNNLKAGEKVSPEINTAMKQQYRLLIKKYHPDLSSGNEPDFKELQNQCKIKGLVDDKGRWIE